MQKLNKIFNNFKEKNQIQEKMKKIFKSNFKNKKYQKLPENK